MKIFFQVLGLALLCAKPGVSAASEFAAYAEASSAYERLLAEAASQQHLPRLSDPVVAKVLDTLTDHRRFLQGQDFTSSDFPKLLEMCAVTEHVSAKYASFGMEAVPSELDLRKVKLSEAQKAILERNSSTFRHEIVKLEPFIHRCGAKIAPLLQSSVLESSTHEMSVEQRRETALMQRRLVARLFRIAGMVEDASIDLQSRKNLVETMAEVAPSYADVLTMGHRMAVVTYLAGFRNELPDELGRSMQEVMDAMTQERCVGLCDLRRAEKKK